MSEPTEVRRALSEAKRDWAGFIEGEQPHLTEDQFAWLAARLGVDTDAAAFRTLGETELSPITVAGWRADPGFAAIEQIALGNKREGFKMLSTHLLPKALRRINGLLDAPSPRDVVKGVQLLLRVQGLLVDKVALVNKDDLANLFERLREPTQVTALPGPSVVEGEYTESAGA